LSFDQESLINLIEGDKELLASLLTLFEDGWPKLLDQIRSALQNNDQKTVYQFAHRLKGTLHNFYAKESVELAQRLEDIGKAGLLKGAEPLVDQLETQLVQVQEDLRSFLDKMNKSGD